MERLEDAAVVPFIGAGLSCAGGFPTWKNHLRQQGETAGIPAEHIADLLSNGHYEAVIEEIENGLGRDVFAQEIRDVFSRSGSVTSTAWLIAELFPDTVITTNYDRLIELAFSTGEEDPYQIINCTNGLDEEEPHRVSIVKVHGDIKNPARCILSKNQYDAAYGNPDIDMALTIPKTLDYHFRNSSLLFLGCSLNNDRTIDVFRKVKEKIGDADTPQHFAIEQAPESLEDLIARNAYLLRLGITGIWFEKDQFDLVDDMLRHARNELSYRGVVPGRKKAIDLTAK